MKAQLVEQDCPNKRGNSIKVKQSRLAASLGNVSSDSLESVDIYPDHDFVASHQQDPVLNEERPMTRQMSSTSLMSEPSPSADKFPILLNLLGGKSPPVYLSDTGMSIVQLQSLPFSVKVIDYTCIPLVLHSVTLELTLRNPRDKQSLLSSRMFHPLAARKPDTLELAIDSVGKFTRSSCSSSFRATIRNKDRHMEVKMENLTKEMKEALERLFEISSKLDDIMAINCVVHEVADPNIIKVDFTINMEPTVFRAKTAFESHSTFKSLPLTDELILLKQGYTSSVGVSSLFVYDRFQDSSFCFPFFNVSIPHKINTQFFNLISLLLLQGRMMMCISLDKMSQLISHPFDNMFTFIDGFDDRLRKDYLLKNLLIMTVLFKKCDGLSSPDVIEKEGQLYLALLEEYIRALVSGGHCVESYEEILFNVHITRSRLATSIPLYENITLQSPSLLASLQAAVKQYNLKVNAYKTAVL